MLRRDFLSASAFALLSESRGTGSARTPIALRNVLDYGAKPDGTTLNTKAIQGAIDEIVRTGGGTVYVPPGAYLVGGLELKSGVTLYLEAGCTLLGSPAIDDYPYHPGPPMQGDANGHHLLFARKADNIGLCGQGTIDGQGHAYWQHKGAPPQSGTYEPWKNNFSGSYEPKDNNRRPSPMIEFAECSNVRVADVTLKNSAGWTIRPIACESVLIQGIRIRNPNYGPNTDGIDITASRNVLISNCDISTGDDALCVKSENPYGELLPTKNITITNCTLSTPCNGFKIGTASHGIVENIVFSNSVIYVGTNNPADTHKIGGINIEVVDGGSVDGVIISNVRIQNALAPIFVRLGERQKKAGSFLRNVLIENVDATGAIVTSSITGVPGLRPSDITVSNCRIRTMEQGSAEWTSRDIPEVPDKYPEAWMMGRLPAYGFFIRHADRVRLRDVELITDKPDARPAVVCDDSTDLILSGLDLAPPVGDAPLIDLRNSRKVFLTRCQIPTKFNTFVQISGEDSSDISIAGNSFTSDERPVAYSGGATVKALRLKNPD